VDTLGDAVRITPFLMCLCAVFLVACSSTTTIRSEPDGAVVYLNGERVGRTPYPMRDKKIVGSTTSVRLEHPDCKPLDAAISRDEQLDVGALIAGLLTLVPLLWVMEYKPSHQYELEPKADGNTAGE